MCKMKEMARRSVFAATVAPRHLREEYLYDIARLNSAFASLRNEHGILALHHFCSDQLEANAACSAYIGAEHPELEYDAWVYYHEGSTDKSLEQHKLRLHYGFSDTVKTTKQKAALTQQIVDTLRNNGLMAEWRSLVTKPITVYLRS